MLIFLFGVLVYARGEPQVSTKQTYDCSYRLTVHLKIAKRCLPLVSHVAHRLSITTSKELPKPELALLAYPCCPGEPEEWCGAVKGGVSCHQYCVILEVVSCNIGLRDLPRLPCIWL